MNSVKTCTKCHETKPLYEFHNQKSGKCGKNSVCKKCKKEVDKKYNQEHSEEIRRNKKEYYEKTGRQKAGHKPMYENKSCSQYLGVVIAERLCRHLFKDVKVMSIHNPGYDIVCNHGKKIDVKSGCICLDRGKYPKWEFKIKHNTTADYFICVAFDNVEDLNPLHMWMIPGKEINHRRGISIRPSTIHKWDKWKRDINDAKLCCAEIKSYNQSSKPLRF